MKAAICLVIILFCPSLGHGTPPEERWVGEQGEKAVQEARRRIEAEIKGVGKHAWAGEYHKGDGLGMNVHLWLAPKAGFAYERHGCVGLYDHDHGVVTEKDGKLRLSFTLEHRREPDLELIPVSWGERKYLVSPDKFIKFCNEINSGFEPRDRFNGEILLRVGDEQKPATGRSEVPKRYEPYLLPKPVETEIVAVGKVVVTKGGGDVQVVKIPVTLRHGAKAGLLAGMELHVIKPQNISESIEVTKVEEEQSEGTITRYIDGGVLGWLVRLQDSNPKIGWKLSTRFR